MKKIVFRLVAHFLDLSLAHNLSLFGVVHSLYLYVYNVCSYDILLHAKHNDIFAKNAITNAHTARKLDQFKFDLKSNQFIIHWMTPS